MEDLGETIKLKKLMNRIISDVLWKQEKLRANFDGMGKTPLAEETTNT